MESENIFVKQKEFSRMVYISPTGEVLSEEPFTWRTVLRKVWSAIDFIIVFFLSIVGMEHLWRQSRINRYFMGSNRRGFDDHSSGSSGWGWGSGGGGGGNGGGGGGGGRPGGGGPRSRIHTLPRNSNMGVPSCPGGACGR